MVLQTKSSPSFSQRKISETFLEFTAPLLGALVGGPTKDQYEQILKFGYTVWNAAVFDAIDGQSKYIAQIRELTAGDPIIAAMTEQLIGRKQTMFADDHRLIGEYTLTWKNGEWCLRAEARDPTTRARG